MRDFVNDYLSRDRVLFSGVLFAASQPEARVLFADESGLLIGYQGLEYMSATSAAAAERIAKLVSADCAVAFEPFFGPLLLPRGYVRDLHCHCCLYESSAPVPLSLPAGVEIRQLSHDCVDFVLEHYSHADGDRDYVSDRVDNGMFGLYENGEMAGFIGVHNSGEMGLLEILPAYRRKGYAHLLEGWLINRRLADGCMPFSAVETKNEPSLKLQRGLGMRISTGACDWYGR